MFSILILINICWSISLLCDTFQANLIEALLHLTNDIFLLHNQIYHSGHTNCDCKEKSQEPKTIRKWYHTDQKKDNKLDLLIFFQGFVTP